MIVVGTSANKPSSVAVPEHITAALDLFNILDDSTCSQLIFGSSFIKVSTNSLAELS